MRAKERGIIFNTEDVKAILSGRKTVTRRPVKPQPKTKIWKDVTPNGELHYFSDRDHRYGNRTLHMCPFGQIGDRIWVRETWSDTESSGQGLGYTVYKSEMPFVYQDVDEDEVVVGSDSFKWKPSIHMPKKYARIWLEIADIRVERLGDITEEDEEKEGINYLMEDEDSSVGRAFNHAEHYSIAGAPMRYSPEKYGMIGYFESVGLMWNDNPWVWVIEFKKNISNDPIR